MSIEIAVRRSFGRFTLDIAIASQARVVALFGPSGAGKSTVLQIVAGLDAAAEGRVAVDGTVLQDSARGIFLPAHRRAVGYVFQDARLFPHFSVRGNLRYGARMRRRGPTLATFDDVVDLLSLGALVDRDVTRLSGGEKQRVAIGRALLSRPRILLMDEPLAALDAARRDETLPYIERLRDALTLPMLYVSHSLDEIRRIAQETVHVAAGKVAGPPLRSDEAE